MSVDKIIGKKNLQESENILQRMTILFDYFYNRTFDASKNQISFVPYRPCSRMTKSERKAPMSDKELIVEH